MGSTISGAAFTLLFPPKRDKKSNRYSGKTTFQPVLFPAGFILFLLLDKKTRLNTATKSNKRNEMQTDCIPLDNNLSNRFPALPICFYFILLFFNVKSFRRKRLRNKCYRTIFVQFPGRNTGEAVICPGHHSIPRCARLFIKRTDIDEKKSDRFLKKFKLFL